MAAPPLRHAASTAPGPAPGPRAPRAADEAGSAPALRSQISYTPPDLHKSKSLLVPRTSYGTLPCRFLDPEESKYRSLRYELT